MINYEMIYGNEEFETIADLEMKTKAGIESKKSLRRRYGIFSIVTGLMALSELGGIGNPYIFVSCLGFACLAAASFGLYIGVEKSQRNRLIRDVGKMIMIGSEKRTYGFDENQMTICSEIGKRTIPWSSLGAYGERGHYLWMRLRSSAYIMIDKNLMPSEDLKELEGYLPVK